MSKQFSSRLAETIEALGMSPTDFARKAKIPQGTISKILSGHVPTARILLRISKFTGKSVDWLLVGTAGKNAGPSSVAEPAARYGGAGAAVKAKPSEQVWVEKLLKVLRGSDRRKTQTLKDILDVLSRDD